MKIIDGRAIANEIYRDIKGVVASLSGRAPALSVVIVGENHASQVYVSRKAKACAEVGITSEVISLPASTTQEALLSVIADLNGNSTIDGILVQFPLPPHIHSLAITEAIDPTKDVDGFHPANLGKLLLNDPSGFIPCTPLGIQALLMRSGVVIEGKHVVILGRSTIVGRPLANLLSANTLGANATVTVLHRQSKHATEIARTADIVIAAIGSPEWVRREMVKEGAVVIDVGINRIEDNSLLRGYRLVGDVAFDEVAPVCSAITPVPGGVGPMTIAMLLSNTLKSYQQRCGF